MNVWWDTISALWWFVITWYILVFCGHALCGSLTAVWESLVLGKLLTDRGICRKVKKQAWTIIIMFDRYKASNRESGGSKRISKVEVDQWVIIQHTASWHYTRTILSYVPMTVADLGGRGGRPGRPPPPTHSHLAFFPLTFLRMAFICWTPPSWISWIRPCMTQICL